MFLPNNWPSYYDYAKGCNIWDLDGNKYIDMSYMGIGCCVLGYSDDDVNKSVIKAIKKGSMTTLNCPEEVKLGELLIKLHPWAKMVRYSRSGGEAMSIAIRIGRAYSKKDYVLFCGYHGWHDWYLAANLNNKKSLDGHLMPGLEPLGVPRKLKGLTIPFDFNNSEKFFYLINKYKNKIGAIVLETVRNFEPEKDFIFALNKYKNNIPLILDEITAGFRLNCGGSHLIYGIEPDIAVFAKGISNGFPMAAIIGKKNIMKSAQNTFISSTYWTERIGPVAAISTIEKFLQNNVHKHLNEVGEKIGKLWNEYAQKYNLKIRVMGINPLKHFDFNYKSNLILKTLFNQFMLEKGIIANTSFYSSFAHKNIHINKYSVALDETFKKIKEIEKLKNYKDYLNGPICHTGFKRLN